jgi:hypothetical protein
MAGLNLLESASAIFRPPGATDAPEGPVQAFFISRFPWTEPPSDLQPVPERTSVRWIAALVGATSASTRSLVVRPSSASTVSATAYRAMLWQIPASPG